MKLTEQQIQELEKQLTCPKGEMGIEVGKTMNESNIGMTLNSIEFLEIKDDDKILELGHGNCGHLNKILEIGNVKYFGLEISETMFNEAQKNNLNNLAEFQLYSGEKIPYSDDFFDKIFTVNTIYFWKEPLKILTEIERVLKSNGVCILTYANKDFMKDLPFVREEFELYDQENIKNLIAKTNFNILDIKELKEKVKSKSGELVNRIYTMVKIGKL